MWGRKKNSQTIDTIIAEGTKITGNLNIKGNLFIDGNIEGDIRSDNSQNSVVSIGLNGSIEGNLYAPYVIIFGKVHGDVHASEKVELKPGAKVSGDLFYKVMEMNAGAEVNGKMVAMGEMAQLEHQADDEQESTDDAEKEPYNVAKAAGVTSE